LLALSKDGVIETTTEVRGTVVVVIKTLGKA